MLCSKRVANYNKNVKVIVLTATWSLNGINLCQFHEADSEIVEY